MWAVIEAEDGETGDWLAHIVPIVEVEGFDTREQAEAFLERVVAAGNPCITDEDDNITGTYFGHTLTASCQCGAYPKEADPGCYIHKKLN